MSFFTSPTKSSSNTQTPSAIPDTPTRRRLGFISTSHLASQPPSTITTLQTLIEDGERLEEEAREAMPYSVRECSYSQGALRQEIFACIDCGGKGVCYACSVSCHADHNLVELFTRRSFRCDCPTSSCPYPQSKTSAVFASASSSSSAPTNPFSSAHAGPSYSSQSQATPSFCTLAPRHSQPYEPTSSNRYGPNFLGEFCRCGRHYDPMTEKESMICCLGCEDWFHESCLNLQTPAPPVQTPKKPSRPTTPIVGARDQQFSPPESSTVFTSFDSAPFSTSTSSISSVSALAPETSISSLLPDHGGNNVENGGKPATPAKSEPGPGAGARSAKRNDGEEDEEDLEESPILPSSQYEHLICASCVVQNEYLIQAAGTEGWMMVVRAEPAHKDEGERENGVGLTKEWKDQWRVIGRVKEMENGGSKLEERARAISESNLTISQAGEKRKLDSAVDDNADESKIRTKRTRVEEGTTSTSISGAPSVDHVEVDACVPKDTQSSRCSRPISVPSVRILLDAVKAGDTSKTQGDIFLVEGMREKICGCDQCKLPFPLIEEETYQPPEDEEEEESMEEITARALNQLPRSQAIEGLIKFNQMKDKLKTFLEGFRGQDKVVGPGDIAEFMEGFRR